MALLETAGYACTRAAASLSAFEIIGSAQPTSSPASQDSRLAGNRRNGTLKLFPVPPNCRNLFHRYRDGCGPPDVKEL